MTDHQPTRAARDIPQSTLSELARLATNVGTRPVDALIDRLESPGGSTWFAEALAGSPMATGTSRVTPVPNVGVTIEELRAEKERGKRLMAARPGTPEFNRGVLLYLLAVAVARALHATMISSQSQTELESTLGDLATALPPAWGNLCARSIRM